MQLRSRGALHPSRAPKPLGRPRARTLASAPNQKAPPPPTSSAPDSKKAAAEKPQISVEEAFEGHAPPPSFREMLMGGQEYAEPGTFDSYVKLGKRLADMFGTIPMQRGRGVSVGSWRIDKRDFSEENRFWQRWGTLGGDIVHYPLMELPYDTHLRDPDDYLLAYALKTDIYRLNQYAPVRAIGPRHWTRLNAPSFWKADELLDLIISGPLKFVQGKWWSVFPSFSILGSKRNMKMRLAFQTESGQVLDEVPFNGELRGVGPQLEMGYRLQRGLLLPHPTLDAPPELDVIPRAIHHDGGFDFSFSWVHFGWLNLRAFPSRYLFYWGLNLPLPSFGMQAIEPGQLVRDKEDMPHGWDRKTTLRTYEDTIMHEAFPITKFTVGTSRNAKLRKPLADELDLMIKFLLQRTIDKQVNEATERKRIEEQRKGDTDIAANMLKEEAVRAEKEKQAKMSEADFASLIKKAISVISDPDVVKKVDDMEKASEQAKMSSENWSPFDRVDASLLAELGVERKFKQHYLNRLVERFDIWLEVEDDLALDDDVLEQMRMHRPSYRGGPTIDFRKLQDNKLEADRVRAGAGSIGLGEEFPMDALQRPEFAEYLTRETKLHDYFEEWWYRTIWRGREQWAKTRVEIGKERRASRWLTGDEEKKHNEMYDEAARLAEGAFKEQFQPEDGKEVFNEEEDIDEEIEEVEAEEKRDAGGDQDDETKDPRSKIMQSRRRPKPPPERTGE